MAVFIAYDANGTDGTNLALMSAIYEVLGHRVRIPADTAPQDVDAALAAAVGADQAALVDMIATFTVTTAAITYFNALQTNIRDLSLNGTIDIATVFPAMRTLLQVETPLYNRYLNLLRISTGINQATFEGSPTAAQQRNAFIVAMEFANTGMIQMIAGVMFG